jgi:hypothetical protein
LGAVLQESEETTSFRAQLLLPEQRQLYDYWLDRAAGRTMPERRDISPVHLPRLLPCISLIDVAPELCESRVRLAGTRLRDVYDGEITGKQIDQLFADDRREYWMTAFRHTVHKARPTQGVARGPHCAKDHLVQYWLKLPLRTTNDGVGMILCIDVFLQATEEYAAQRKRALA